MGFWRYVNTWGGGSNRPPLADYCTLHYRKRFTNSKNDLIFVKNSLKIVHPCRKRRFKYQFGHFFQSMSKSCQFVKHYVAVLPKFGKNAVKLQKLAWCCQILNCKQQNLVNVTVPKNIQYSGVHSLYKILLLETIKNMTDKKWHLRITKTYWWVTSEEQLKSDFFKASLHQIQVSVIIIYKPTSSFHDWLPYLWFFREYLQTLRALKFRGYVLISTSIYVY